jgi:integrase
MQLSPILFVSAWRLRRAEWNEIDLEKAEWRIPAAKMKGRAMHIVPLSRQAVAILDDLKPLTGHSTWVFPGVRTNGEPMSENTVNAALRRLGYDRTTLTAHGFRGMASTCCTSKAGHPTYRETALACGAQLCQGCLQPCGAPPCEAQDDAGLGGLLGQTAQRR